MFGVLRAVSLGALHLALAGSASAQEGVPFGEGPRFMATVAGSGAPVEVEISSVPMLHRRISLAIEDELLKDALERVAREADVKFVYSPNVIDSAIRISLRAENMTVAAVLTDLLVDAQVDVLLSGGRYLTLTPREANALVPMTGTIVGTVTEAETERPVVNAQISVDGRGRALTNQDGSYRIDGVEPGRRTVAVTSIGYVRASSEVDVGDGATVTVDFALEVSPTALNELVVTATGLQRRVELGHVVEQINADSVVRSAPVGNVTDLITARVPGLMVQPVSGTVGGDIALRVRSTNSLSLSLEPIVIVDGIRYLNNPRAGLEFFSQFGRAYDAFGTFGTEGTSRINDLNPNDIESIEVVKGPSATTLYGTDAANGVVVITTKRGRPGPPRWNAYARAAVMEIPEHAILDGYWGWGSATSNCSLEGMTLGFCVQDSVSVMPSALRDRDLTVLSSKPTWEYGGNISGGSQDLHYYVSADYSDATGPIQLPRQMIEEVKARRGVDELPEEMLEPNTFTKLNLRSTTTALLGDDASFRLNASYNRTTARTLRPVADPFFGAAEGTSPENPYASFGAPDEIFAVSSAERVDRYTTSLVADWGIAPWLQTAGTIGVDLTNSLRSSLVRPGETPSLGFPGRFGTGMAADERTRHLVTTADLRTTTSFRAGRWSSRSSIGGQYVRTLRDGLSTSGSGLPPGATFVSAAQTITTNQNQSETITLGTFFEQMFGLNDRLFVIGAVRADGASGFGQDFDVAFYPKASASWLLSEERFLSRLPWLNELRLRYAFGASGQQPFWQWTNPTFSLQRGQADGVAGTVLTLAGIGNPDLKPERVREHELGLDFAGLGNRIHAELTWMWRRTVDALTPVPVVPSLGSFQPVWTNIGLITGRGFEARLTTQLIETRSASLEVAATHAWHTDKVVDLGGRAPELRADGQGYAEGYPIGSRFSRRLLGFEDANDNGIIEPNEVQLTDEQEFVGRGIPPRTQTLVDRNI